MNDQQLLEDAALAAGVRVPPLNAYPWHGIDNGGIWTNTSAVGHLEPKKRKYIWAPLTDDGDALRLAVKLHLTVQQGASVYVYADPDFCDPDFSGLEVCESLHKDPYAATRRAIVRAAAEIGKGMK